MLPRLHIVTDDAVLTATSFVANALEILSHGGKHVALHLRAHQAPVRALWRVAEQLVPAASSAGAVLLVNDRIDVALGAGAHGVQLGRRSLPVDAARQLVGALWIGYSAHEVNEAARAEEQGTDFVLLGTIYPSLSHPELAPAGAALLHDAIKHVRIPVIAIGGMTPGRLPQVLMAGAHGVAAISAIWRAPEPARAATEFLAAIALAAAT